MSYQDLEKVNSSKSVLLIHNELQKKIGGKSNLLKFARNIGSVKVIILNSESTEDYSIEEEMGGAYLQINYDSSDEVIKEIVYQLMSSEKYSFSDKKTKCLINMVEKVAKTDVTVFIHGPTGTGKEVISNLIHKKSVRADKPFIAAIKPSFLILDDNFFFNRF